MIERKVYEKCKHGIFNVFYNRDNMHFQKNSQTTSFEDIEANSTLLPSC